MNLCSKLLCLANFYNFYSVSAIWIGFDLVRPWLAWGSKGTTPFLKITGDKLIGKKENSSQFGYSVANIGDVDGDGIADLAVGAIGESCIQNKTYTVVASGAVYILLMTVNGTVKSHTRISGYQDNGPMLIANDRFGHCITKWSSSVIAVGAPGTYTGGVYLLYLNPTGTLQKYRLLRGKLAGNGPTLNYGNSFGSSVTNLGDINGDGVPDLAVGAGNEGGGGDQKVYILFMHTNGTIASYTAIGSAISGAPTISAYVFFGSGVANAGDLDKDGVNDLAVGAKWTTDLRTTSQVGAIYVFLLRHNGTVKSWHLHSSDTLPFQESDNCGASLVSIGDLNRDDLRAKHPLGPNQPVGRRSIPDLLVGCPQTKSGTSRGSTLTGRAMVLFMNTDGQYRNDFFIPGSDVAAPKLHGGDLFGTSVGSYVDIDNNGITEMLVGAPGDAAGGAVYILFPRRRRYHQPPFDWVAYYLKLILPFAISGCICFWGTLFCCWYFRRRATEIEIAVKEVGVETGVKRKRVKHKKAAKTEAYADHYFE